MTGPLLSFWKNKMNFLNKLNEKEKRIIDTVLNSNNEFKNKIYLVGGVVRDLLMEKKIKDIDFLIEGSAIDFAKNSNLKIKSIHEPFNTVKVEILGEEIDIASTRIETYDYMGSLPNVIETGVKIEDDLKRRDFTINSIAYNLHSNKIIDPYLGQEDIKKGVLKILHEKSFLDDPTRILRGLDFKYRFNFEFDENTTSLIKNCLETFNNEHLSIDRIYLTLNKIFSYSYSNKILADILNCEIYKIWQNKTDLKTSDIVELDKAKEIFNVFEQNKLYILALESIFYIKAPFKNDFEIYEFFKNFNNVQLALYYFKTKDESTLKYLKIKNIKPEINGHDLKKLGFSQGRFIGIILKDILKEKILNPNAFISKQSEIDFVLKNYSPD